MAILSALEFTTFDETISWASKWFILKITWKTQNQEFVNLKYVTYAQHKGHKSNLNQSLRLRASILLIHPVLCIQVQTFSRDNKRGIMDLYFSLIDVI